MTRDAIDTYRSFVLDKLPVRIAMQHWDETPYRFYCMFLVFGAADGWPRLYPEVILGEVGKLRYCERKGLPIAEYRWHPLEPPGADWADPSLLDARGRAFAVGSVSVYFGMSARARRIIEAAESASPGDELFVELARALNDRDWSSCLNITDAFCVVPWMPGWTAVPVLDALRPDQVDALKAKGWIA